MKRWLTMAGVIGLLVTVLAAPGVQAASKKLYVGTCAGTPQYQTIQSAVGAVNDDGFTIYVCPGTYNESVQVNNKEDLTIRNYVVKNQPAPLINAGGGDGFDVGDSNEVEIRGLRITNATYGIFAIRAPETKVRNTIITNTSYGIVFADGSNKSEAQLNTMSNTTYGMAIGYTSDVTAKQNTIASGDYGIYVVGATKPKLESNSTTNTRQYGFYLEAVTRATVKKNTTNFTQYGIFLQRSTINSISEHTAKNNSSAGVFVDQDSTGNSFKKNLLQGNGTDAFDNTTGTKTAGTANTWSSNTCDTSLPSDLCGSPATQRRAPPTPPTPPTFPKR